MLSPLSTRSSLTLPPPLPPPSAAARDAEVGCLFDVLADPSERHDLALERPAKAREIRAKMARAEARWYNPDRGEPDPRACAVARASGFWQPFLP